LIASFGLFHGLRGQGAWLLVSALVAVCSLSMGLASLWAATHPLPDPHHNPGALGVGMFAAPFLVLLASFALSPATWLRLYLVVNVLLFGLVAALFAGLLPVDLRLYGGAVQRFGALVMMLPLALLCVWLLRNPPRASGR
jgi:hypothetical protein